MEQVLLEIAVDASARRPWCHFELPPTEYRSRRQADTPLDPKYQIVEFESLGTKVKNTKRFYVLNPTAEEYEFQWLREGGHEVEDQDPFRCLSKHGKILPGKKFEMIFEYVPLSVPPPPKHPSHESYWTFIFLGKQDV